MNVSRPHELQSLLHELCKLPHETAWVEFKENNDNPEQIGEYISALSNAAALSGKLKAYLVWGVQDQSHQIVGTRFSPTRTRVGNEELENWLFRLIKPTIHFEFHEFETQGVAIVILEIEKAFRHPTKFKSEEFVRVGSYKKKLKEFPDKERQLWRALDRQPFETIPAKEKLSGQEVFARLDHQAYFHLLGEALIDNQETVLERLNDEQMISRRDDGLWDILNLGALLLAYDLTQFKSLARKSIRVIMYQGKNKLRTLTEREFKKGYALSFEEIMVYLSQTLPSNEVLEHAFRRIVTMYPDVALRELTANAMIHQDFFVRGAAPMIEIYENRIEFTNPGAPLVEPIRFLDKPPRSRNEATASFMRRIGLCEERGSGVDKIVSATEAYQLPAPIFEDIADNTKATLFAQKSFAEMERSERIRACYLHTCLRYVTSQTTTNASLRERFQVNTKNSAQISRLLRDTVQEELIKAKDKSASKRFMEYVPFWA